MAECLIGLRRAVREMQWRPLSPVHYSTLRAIAWWVQEIVDSLGVRKLAPPYAS